MVKNNKWILPAALVLIVLGMIVTAGSHVYILVNGLELELVKSHSVANIIATALIFMGAAGLTWRVATK